MVIRGATLVDGTGAPAIGPVDIVIENDKIARIVSVGYPKVPIKESRRPEKGDYEIDATGMYVLPGFINAHAHIADANQGKVGTVPPAEYVYKLWLAHGITTVREAGSFNGLRWTLNERRRSAAHEIVAPRIAAYAGFPVEVDTPGGVSTPQERDAGWMRLPPQAPMGSSSSARRRRSCRLPLRKRRSKGCAAPAITRKPRLRA